MLVLADWIQTYAPYVNNKQAVVKNVDDYFAQIGSTAAYDPIAQWAWLDDKNHQGKCFVRVHVGPC